MSLLSLNNISFLHGTRQTLNQVSLEVPVHQTLGLVGESGSGKSTLARIIVGLLAAESGTVVLDGKPLGPRRTRDQHRRIQMVFQNPDESLNPKLTVGQQLAEALLFHRRAPRNEIRHRCEELLGQVELDFGLFDRYPRALSGGQRQRVAIARALGVEPDLLVADEPTSALDVSVQRSILDLFQRLKDQRSLTTVFISHDLGVIHEVSDQVAVLRHGQVLEVGSKSAFFSCPQTEYGRDLLKAVPTLKQEGGAPSAQC